MRSLSRSSVGATTLSVGMKDVVGERRHRHRPHPVALMQGAEAIENGPQKRQVALQIGAEIVRVPP